MYIKQIIIQGFKSYKDQTEIERFSPGLNVIVGRNGSGKSNFFAAIRFVLSDAYTQMSREERQALLHEGSGSAVMSAYVEIIFDNSDERFPTGKPELVLRRTIGLKKDEYSLDRKNATRSDVMNLLESAGFSRSNPYYIVPQGRVTALTNMKDLERLLLLKEVAGTQVYEARRTESLKSMQNAENLQSKVDVLLDNVDERLGQLEEEKEELRKYQERDRESRCLQYTILHREQQEYNAAIAKFDGQRNHATESSDEIRDRLDQFDQEIAALEHTTTEARQAHDLQNLEKRQLDEERKDAQRDKAKLELEVQSLTAGQSSAQQAQTKHAQELQQVQQLIKEREIQLSKLVPQYDQAKVQEQEVEIQVGEAEATQKRLYTKQGRTSQFKNKAERDKYLKEEIDDVNIQLAQRKALSMQTNEEISEMQEDIIALEQSIEEKKNRMDGRGDDLQNIASEIEKAREQQEQLMDRRKELWREEQKLQSTRQASQTEFDNAQQDLQRLMDRNTWHGIQTVRRIKEEHDIEGVYGTLGELFEVRENDATAVEVTGGTSLFNFVVDNDETASRVLDILNREKGGRVTFMPLNRLNPKSPNMPNAQDAISMISRLTYDKRFEKAFQQVFGKSVICPNLQVASQYARSNGVSAITPQGDRADKKGSLTGGFHDTRRSRLKAISRENQLRVDLEERKTQLDNVKDEIARLNQDITKAVGDVQKLEQRRVQTDNSFGPLRQELRSEQAELHRLRLNLESKQASKKFSAVEERRMGEEQSAFEAELNSPFTKTLSSQEEQQLESLSLQIRDLRKALPKHTETRSTVESQKNALEQELNENLRLRLDQLTSRDFDNETGGRLGDVGSQLKTQQRELKRATKVLSELERKVAEVEVAVEKGAQQLATLEQQRADKQQSREELVRTIEKQKARMESNMRRKAEASKLLAEVTKKIRDLGVLPEEAFKKYERWESKKAMDRLQKVNKELKQYKNVNKKAFEQFNNFTKQRTDLKKRREELDSSKTSIQNLVDHLDRKKDEAIERTFKQVSKEFATVFEKLVPAGKGRLIIQRKSDKQARAQDSDDESEEERRQSVENYIGVGISVSFNSKHDEQQRIQQLSGGQKSLCALALVFAIQQCDPAPFYLFDEIDANLDAQYRTAVAQMLKTLSEAREGGGQFICTTFRPEMLLVAEKCYGVSFSNKTSSVDVVTREQAMDFVENTQTAR